jgi:hypothetical protein
MADGLSTVNFANALLNTVNDTSFAISATWVQIHVGSPGANGTANPAYETTRQQATFSAASSGALALSTSPSPWNITIPSGSEIITDISVWSASTGGTFYWSAPLAVSKTVEDGDTLTLNTCGLSLSPLAA